MKTQFTRSKSQRSLDRLAIQLIENKYIPRWKLYCVIVVKEGERKAKGIRHVLDGEKAAFFFCFLSALFGGIWLRYFGLPFFFTFPLRTHKALSPRRWNFFSQPNGSRQRRGGDEGMRKGEIDQNEFLIWDFHVNQLFLPFWFDLFMTDRSLHPKEEKFFSASTQLAVGR